MNKESTKQINLKQELSMTKTAEKAFKDFFFGRISSRDVATRTGISHQEVFNKSAKVVQKWASEGKISINL